MDLNRWYLDSCCSALPSSRSLLLSLFLYLSYLSLTVSAYSPPKVLNQPDPLPVSTRIYVPTQSQGAGEANTIVAVDGRTGVTAWRWTLPTTPNVSLPITWPPAEADGVLYLAQVTTWPIGIRSTVYALSASDGVLLRTFTIDGAIDWLGASAGGQVPAVLGFRSGQWPSLPTNFGALDPTSGQVLWRQT